MCTVDAEAKEADVARFLQKYPHVGSFDIEHPALRGCADVAWPEIPGCPRDIPSLFSALLDTDAAVEAARVLTNVLMDSPFHLSAAMPAALPFLLRLAADPDVPARPSLLDLVIVTAELSQPVDADDERSVLVLGSDSDRPERHQCRAVLGEHAPLLRRLMDDALRDGLVNAEDWTCLRHVVGPR